MSWPPPGVDRTLMEELGDDFANAELAERRILTIYDDINLLFDETDCPRFGVPLGHRSSAEG